MRMKSIIDQHRSEAGHGHRALSATRVPTRSLVALRKRLEVAEATVRSLEMENEQLRVERAQAVLAAARATEESTDRRQPTTNEPGPTFEALTKELKIAEAARAEAAREREAAIEAVSDALEAEYSARIAALQEKHADELAALSALADRQAREAVANELELLASDLSEAKDALVIVKRERAKDLRALEEGLGKKYDEKVEALHLHYATVLEKLSKQKKEKFATELASSLSSAHAAWREDTTRQVRRANESAAMAIEEERARWRKRQKRALLRAARVWHRREFGRLQAAREQWKLAQRRSIDACNARWQSKFDRDRKQAQLIVVCSEASAEVWDRVKSFRTSLTTQWTVETGDTGLRCGSLRPTRMQAGLMAALLIFLGVNFTLTAGLPAAPDGSASVVAVAKAPQIASAPVPNSRPTQAVALALPKQKSPGGSGSGKDIATSHAAVDRVGSSSNENVGHVARASKALAETPVRRTVVRPDKRITEQMIRERLRENIRKFRLGRTAN